MTQLKELNKRIGNFKTRGAGWQTEAVELSMTCLEHADEHGNVTPLSNLMNAMPNGSRVQALRVWIIAHATVNIKQDKKTKEFTTKWKEGDHVVLLDEAKETPFYEFSQEHTVVYKPSSMITALKGMATRASKALDNDETLTAKEREEMTALRDGALALVA